MSKIRKRCSMHRGTCVGCPQYNSCLLYQDRQTDILTMALSILVAVIMVGVAIYAVLSAVTQVDPQVWVKQNTRQEEVTNNMEVIPVDPDEEATMDVLPANVNFGEVKILTCNTTPQQPVTVETLRYEATEEEIVALSKVIYKEARGEPYDGKVAIGAVVLNRLESKDSQFNTDSLLSVIEQKGQFASIEGVTLKMLKANPDCRKAAEAALRGEDPTKEFFETGAKFFFNPNTVKGKEKERRKNLEILEIGNHAFHEDF